MKVLRISGVIGWDVFADDVRRKLNEFGNEPIQVIIANSPGGAITEGIEIINLLKSYPGEKSAVISGFVASMATGIVTAFDRESVGVFKNSVFMIHNALLGTYGDYRDHEANAQILKDLTDMLAQNYSDFSGKSLAEVSEMMNEETYVTGGQKIIDENFAGYLLDPSDVELDETANEEEVDKELTITITQAKKAIEFCNKKIKAVETENDRKDFFEKLGAVAKGSLITRTQNKTTNKNETKNNKDGKTMTFAEMLNQHPELKAEFENRLATAVKDASDKVANNFQELVNAVAPILKSESYDDVLKNQAIKVLQNELPVDSFKAIVAQEDMRIEREKKEQAQNETKETGNTPPHHEPPNSEGAAKTADEVSNLAKQDKETGAA